MCLFVFGASDSPLPVIANDPEQPLFTTLPIEENGAPVKQWFSKPYVIKVTYGGCGCGFYYSEADLDLQSNDEVPEEVKANDRRVYAESLGLVARLRKYIEEAANGTSAEVYACWEGDWETEPESRIEVSLDHFRGPSFSFREGEFLTVV